MGAVLVGLLVELGPFACKVFGGAMYAGEPNVIKFAVL